MTDLELDIDTITRAMNNPHNLVRRKFEEVKLFHSFIFSNNQVKEYTKEDIVDYDEVFKAATVVRMLDNHRQLLFLGNADIPYWILVQR